MLPLAEVLDHAEQAAQKLDALGNVHLPVIIQWIRTIQANPLVTSMESAVGGPLAPEAVALLNGLASMIPGVAQQVTPQAPAETAPGAGAGSGPGVTVA